MPGPVRAEAGIIGAPLPLRRRFIARGRGAEKLKERLKFRGDGRAAPGTPYGRTGGKVMKYRKISPCIWNDAKVRELSDKGKLALLFLLTHPHMTPLGAIRANAPRPRL